MYVCKYVALCAHYTMCICVCTCIRVHVRLYLYVVTSSRRWLVTSLGVYGFVVSLILAASIAGGAFYLSGLKQDLNVCKVCSWWTELACSER